MRYYQIILLCTLSIFLSCEQDDLEAIVPAFLVIDNIDVNITKSEQGSASDNITDAWVFVNSEFLGAFELPTIVPVQNTGNVNIKVFGGIKVNGMSNNRERYAFYNFYELDSTLIPDQEYTLTPIVEYTSDAILDNPWSGENFESGINFEYNDNSQTTFERNSTQDVFEGTSSGVARLESDETFFEAFTPTFSNIPRNGTDIFLELNYKSTHDFVVGLYFNNRSNQLSVLNLRARSGWNKIYIRLDEVINSIPGALNFNVSIGYTKAVNEVGELHVDNVKLVHF